MKDAGDLLMTSSFSGTASPSPSGCGDVALLRKGRYKLWAVSAILLLAFWSMLTGTVTLKWSAGNLRADNLDAARHGDLDALEIGEREKTVRHMWDVYAHGQRIRLPTFWQQAFEAAYEDLAGDDAAAKDAAIAEIAMMSIRMTNLEPPPGNPTKSELSQMIRSIDSFMYVVGDDKIRMKPSLLSSGKAK